MTKYILIGLLLATAAFAEDRTPWIEPPLGPISPTGSVIEVQNYRCTVTGPYSIRCMNIGRVCADYRAKDEARSARTFGCAIVGNKNYPCPPDDPAETKVRVESWSMCAGMSFGGM